MGNNKSKKVVDVKSSEQGTAELQTDFSEKFQMSKTEQVRVWTNTLQPEDVLKPDFDFDEHMKNSNGSAPAKSFRLTDIQSYGHADAPTAKH